MRTKFLQAIAILKFYHYEYLRTLVAKLHLRIKAALARRFDIFVLRPRGCQQRQQYFGTKELQETFEYGGSGSYRNFSH